MAGIPSLARSFVSNFAVRAAKSFKVDSLANDRSASGLAQVGQQTHARK